MRNNQLLQTSTTDGLYLQGYYVSSDEKETAVLYIHGMNGHFYEPNFVYFLIKEFEKNNIGFLAGNTRGAGKDTDFNTIKEGTKRIGSRYELLEEAHLDITAWFKLLIAEAYKEVILIGHSAGSVKVVRYLFEGELRDKVNKIILLSPIDSLGARIANGRGNIEDFIKRAQEKVRQGKGEELITPEFDHDLISYQTLISWYKRDDLGRMFEFCSKDYDFPILKKIKIPTKIIVGSKDEYFYPTNPNHPEVAMSILLNNIPNSTGKFIHGASHSFESYESVLAEEVTNFISSI